MTYEYETLTELKIAEDYGNQKEACRDEALESFYDIINKRIMNIEHLVPKDREGEAVYKKNKQVARTIDWVLNEGNPFVYETKIEGRFGDYDEEFSYDFTEYAKDRLSDSLGYYKENR